MSRLPGCAHVYTRMCLHMCALCVHTCYYSHLHRDSFVGGGRNILEETLFLGITDYSHFVWINPVHIFHEAGCGMREGIQSRRGNKVGMMKAACREPRTRLLPRRQVRSWAETDTQTWRHTTALPSNLFSPTLSSHPGPPEQSPSHRRAMS